MTVPVLTQDEFIAHIKSFGWTIDCTDYWEQYNRLIFVKDGRTVVFQCVEKYFYTSVVLNCKIFGITPPIDHIHQYYLHKKMQDEICYCGKELAFKECHGKND